MCTNLKCSKESSRFLLFAATLPQYSRKLIRLAETRLVTSGLMSHSPFNFALLLFSSWCGRDDTVMTTSCHYIEMETERMQKDFIRLLGLQLSHKHRLKQTEGCKELEAFAPTSYSHNHVEPKAITE